MLYSGRPVFPGQMEVAEVHSGFHLTVKCAHHVCAIPWQAGDPRWQKLKPQLAEVYVDLSELVRFLDMNCEGLRKILKKHDKETSEQLLPVYMPRIKESLNDKNRPQVVRAVRELTDTYGVTFYSGQRCTRSLHQGSAFQEESFAMVSVILLHHAFMCFFLRQQKSVRHRTHCCLLTC